ncbi:MAG: hypothetical protein EBU88_19605, partial [Acidobacteria bacterium]|nr:hypothetical protein [Acidobacteriota bacterium]
AGTTSTAGAPMQLLTSALMLSLTTAATFGQCVPQWIENGGLPLSQATIESLSAAHHTSNALFMLSSARLANLQSLNPNYYSRGSMLVGENWSDARLTIPGVSQVASLGTTQWINSADNSYVLGVRSNTTAVARWNGSTLTRLPDLANISSIFVGDSLEGDQLFARVYLGSNWFSPTRVFRLQSDAWQEVNVIGATSEQINKMTFVDSPTGGSLITIRTVNSVAGIYSLTESGWSLLGDIQTRPALPNSPTGLVLFAAGIGTDCTLYVSGWIDRVADIHVKNMAAYRNGAWFNPGDGLEIPAANISYSRGARTGSNIAIISQDAVGSPNERRGGAYRVRLLQNDGWVPITPGFVTNGGPNCPGSCITPLHL